MIEPDNDDALQELIRQRLAGHRPPVDPADWERMRRQLRRKRWRPVAWLVLSGVVLLSIGWYVMYVGSVPVRPLKPGSVVHKPAQKRQVPPPANSVTQPRDQAGTTPARRPVAIPRRVRPLPVPFAAVGITPLEPYLVQLPVTTRVLQLPPVIVHSPAEPDIIRRMQTGAIGSDSTTYRVFSRNLTRWLNAVVVCDFTSSMYRYSTQLMAWFKKNEANKSVEGIVFFTDCDSLGRETEPGRSGQLFTTRSRASREVLPLMLVSARNTMGNLNEAENNIEALLHAQREFPEASHLILVADNSSTVKDMDRLPELHKPVHIILCGPTYDTAQAFQPQYFTIAKQTGGSLHTLEDDLTNVTQLRPNTWIRVDGRYYRLNRRGRFVVTGFRHRPRRLLGLFWR